MDIATGRVHGILCHDTANKNCTKAKNMMAFCTCIHVTLLFNILTINNYPMIKFYENTDMG